MHLIKLSIFCLLIIIIDFVNVNIFILNYTISLCSIFLSVHQHTKMELLLPPSFSENTLKTYPTISVFDVLKIISFQNKPKAQPSLNIIVVVYCDMFEMHSGTIYIEM